MTRSMTPEKIRQNLEALVREGEAVLRTRRPLRHVSGEIVEAQAFTQWSTNLLAILSSVFGKESDHYQSAKQLCQHSTDCYYVEQVLGVAKAAITAWDDGYVFSMQQIAEASVEASLIDQAEELLSKGYLQAAAVLAGAVLEQHLRSLCSKYSVSEHGPNGKPKTMEPLNVDLCKAGAYNALQQKQITYLAGIRNAAAHGNPVTHDDAKRLIEDVISLCAKLT